LCESALDAAGSPTAALGGPSPPWQPNSVFEYSNICSFFDFPFKRPFGLPFPISNVRSFYRSYHLFTCVVALGSVAAVVRSLQVTPILCGGTS
jgi:hypothetical protein